jgi:hypothetical protein
MSNVMQNKTINIVKIIFAIPILANEIPVKPNIPAISDKIRKTIAHRNMFITPY